MVRTRSAEASFRRDEISFAEFDASVQGWINHVRYADTWGLRRHVLGKGFRGRGLSLAALRGPDAARPAHARVVRPAGRLSGLGVRCARGVSP
jgi:hypothetical protein